jgi:hypothetical protein
MKRFAGVLFAAGLACCPLAANADLFSSVSYGVQASTVGDGFTLEKPLLYDFSVRVVGNTGSQSQQTAYDANSYTATTHFRDIGVIGDFRPYGGRYRLSAGLFTGSDDVVNTAHPDGGLIHLNGNTYSAAAAGTVTTRVSYNRPAIYLGAGTGTGLVRGFALMFDAGVLIRNGTTSAHATGALAGDPAFAADLAHAQANLRTRVVTPVLSAGLVFRP